VSQYGTSEQCANTFLAQTCLAYLLQSDSPTFEYKSIVEEFPLALYAAEWWTEHAQKDAKSVQSQSLIMKLFQTEKNQFANWLRILNPDHKIAPLIWPATSIPYAYPLYYVSLSGLEETIKQLLKSESDINAKG
jgi:hypothetical protein